MLGTSRARARSLISQIRATNGGISPEVRARTPQEALAAMDNLAKMAAAATRALTTQLYSTDTRFVYELIQNAEDNQYSYAKANGNDPFLRFCVYQDKIVIDSNEDGFKESDVRSICSVGESSKSNNQGYIGEKGIGFKSVFKIAKKVHIQSEPYSFSFSHSKDSDDHGLGMVTPMDEPYLPLPEDVRTRFTLTLLDTFSSDQAIENLSNLQDTLLLFLAQLRRLQVYIYTNEENPSETTYNVHSSGGDVDTITKTNRRDNQVTETNGRYYVVRREMEDLPEDTDRRYKRENKWEYITRANIVLAFPVDESDVPKMEPQYVYAFLPLRQVGFNFLVQSDFITQASREDVKHIPRNNALLRGVARTFKHAVLKFCKHPTLQYQWLRYLPGDNVSDEFWKRLKPMIYRQLEETQILRSMSGGSLYKASDLLILTADMLDQYGNPLFPDRTPETYLSDGYDKRDYQFLESLGTEEYAMLEKIALVEADLKREECTFKSKDSEDDWHTRVSRLLLTPFERDSWHQSRERVRALSIVPLQDSRWVSGIDLPIYFPGSGRFQVPNDLGLHLVRSDALENTERKRLFVELGVTACEVSKITQMVFSSYRNSAKVTLDGSVSHLRYLYWNLPEQTTSLHRDIFLFNENMGHVYPTKRYVYFGCEGENGPRELFGSTGALLGHTSQTAVHFLNPAYEAAVSHLARRSGRPWIKWLEESVGVKRVPQLRHESKNKLSREFEGIIEHTPGKLASIMKSHWSIYGSEVADFTDILRHTSVPIIGGDFEELKDTYIPLPKLKSITEELQVAEFPFLELHEKLEDGDRSQWQFLEHFGVGTDENLSFYIQLLPNVQSLEQSIIPGGIKALCAIFEGVSNHCVSIDNGRYVRKLFEKEYFIFVPDSDQGNREWHKSTECSWKAPEWLRAKPGLWNIPQYRPLEHFFRSTLDIRDATFHDFLAELEDMSVRGPGKQTSTEKVSKIYDRIWREFGNDSDFQVIREAFEKKRLVYSYLTKSWYPLSKCIWAVNDVKIPRMISIATEYSHLDDLFQRILGVSKPDVGMHALALKELVAKGQAVPSKVKEMIMRISSMKPNKIDLEPLSSSNMFSVRTLSGRLQWTQSTGDFAIIDRKEYEEAFRGKIAILDFSLEEVRACHSFLRTLELQRKYLSELVVEQTRVTGGTRTPKLTERLRSKAYALYRCAYHYESPRTREGDLSILNKLLSATVWESDGILKSMTIVQYGKPRTVEQRKATFHLDEEGEELQLYVPRNKDDRELCYFRQLPKRIMAFMKVFDIEAETVIGQIVNGSSLLIVEKILNDAGIVRVEGVQNPYEPEPDSSPSEDESLTMSDVAESSQTLVETPTDTETPPQFEPDTPSDMYRGQTTRTPSVLSRRRASEESIALLFSGSPSQPSYQSGPYAALLDRVIATARGGILPDYGYDRIQYIEGLEDTLDSSASRGFLFETAFRDRSFERDKKVGAAGELLIFELLDNLHLPGFSRINWKSTIRGEVSVCVKYQDLAPWQGSETSDIVYNDAEGNLTRFLRQHNYLSPTWRHKRPTYYLEVKTTTGECNTEFYMSRSQYRRMKSMKLGPEMSPNETNQVYILLRVFNLERDNIGVKLYIDPETARGNGELVFEAQTYAVKPRK